MDESVVGSRLAVSPMLVSRGPVLMLLLLILILARPAIAETCPPKGYGKQQLQELQAAQFKSLQAAQRDPFALALLPCMGASDPVLRDEIAFESLSALMRSQQLSTQAAIGILQRLQPQLAADFKDPAGFIKPFAALTLAEVARMDRIERFLSEEQWSALVRQATSYVSGVRD